MRLRKTAQLKKSSAPASPKSGKVGDVDGLPRIKHGSPMLSSERGCSIVTQYGRTCHLASTRLQALSAIEPRVAQWLLRARSGKCDFVPRTGADARGSVKTILRTIRAQD